LIETIVLFVVAFIVSFVVVNIYIIREENRTARCVIRKIKNVTDNLKKDKITQEEAFGQIDEIVKNWRYYSICKDD